MTESFQVWDPDNCDEDGADTVQARDVEDAATRWVQLYEAKHCEYTVASGGELTVMVRAPNGVAAAVSVTGEAVPHYWARVLPASEAPLPPDVLANALQDRIHPTSGKLIRATPIKTGGE